MSTSLTADYMRENFIRLNNVKLGDDVKIFAFVNAYRETPAAVSQKVFMSCGVYESLIYENRSMAPLLDSTGMQVKSAVQVGTSLVHAVSRAQSCALHAMTRKRASSTASQWRR